jgi:hypothetical protein
VYRPEAAGPFGVTRPVVRARPPLVLATG